MELPDLFSPQYIEEIVRNNSVLQEIARLHRTSDTQPSRESAKEAVGFKGQHEATIRLTLLDFGPQTSTEIACRSGLTQIQVARRMKGLEAIGYVVRHGEKRGASGRLETVWVAA